MEQTAVNWLIKNLMLNGLIRLTQDQHSLYKELTEEAKAMEQDAIIQAYSNGWHDGQDVILNQVKHIDSGGDETGKHYFNDTFNTYTND